MNHHRGSGLYVVDTSVWARLNRCPEIKTALDRYFSQGVICVALPTLLEIGFTARTPQAWDEQMETFQTFVRLSPGITTGDIALNMQSALWHQGKIRAAGAFDTLIAAIAVENNATLVHYDRDYEHLSQAYPSLNQEWIVPAGTVD
jgi:predicted nucleic acid-binding protein